MPFVLDTVYEYYFLLLQILIHFIVQNLKIISAPVIQNPIESWQHLHHVLSIDYWKISFKSRICRCYFVLISLANYFDILLSNTIILCN